MSAVRVKRETEPLLPSLRSAGARLSYRFDEPEATAMRIALPRQGLARGESERLPPPPSRVGVHSAAMH